MNHNRFVARQFVKAFSDLRGGNVDGAGNMFGLIHFGGADVQNKQISEICSEVRLNQSFAGVFDRHADNIDGILRRRIGRGIAQFGVPQVLRRSVQAHNRRNHVNAFVNTLRADGLCAQNFAVFFIQYFQGQFLCVGIVSGVGSRSDDHFFVRNI